MLQLGKWLFVLTCVAASSLAQSQVNSSLASCTISSATLPDLLVVEDDLSQFGPKLEAVQLVVLKNQRKAVNFSVRNVPVNGSFQLWNVRYKVTWQDACGRLLPDVSNSIDGFVLHPNDVRDLQEVAFDMRSVRATLKVFIE
jgi:hypothetical protein